MESEGRDNLYVGINPEAYAEDFKEIFKCLSKGYIIFNESALDPSLKV